MSVANWFLGDVSFTFSLSRKCSKSFHHISSLLHLTSCKIDYSAAWSAPTKAYLLFAGLANARKMISSDFNRDVLPQFAAPTINTLWNLPLPCVSKCLISSANMKGFMLFSWSTCLAHSYHSISQPSIQLSDWHFISTSIVVAFSRSMKAFALFIFQVFSMRSLRALLDLDNTKPVKSVFPSFFLLLAS